MPLALDAEASFSLDGDVAELMEQPPAVRGFWTDDELLEVAHLASVPTLKKLAATLWINPGYVPIAGGGRRRAWPFRETARAVVAARLSQASGLAVIGVATLLQSLPTDWIDAVLETKGWIEFADQADARPPSDEPPGRICVVDLREVWRELSRDVFELRVEGLVIVGADMRAPLSKHPRQVRTFDELVGYEAAVLVLNAAMVARPFLYAVASERRSVRGYPQR